MKICITEKSVKDFNSFFRAKALELQKKNNYTTVKDLYKALYNEALSLSGDTQSTDNHDVIIQHLVLSPLALNNTIPELQGQISKLLSQAMSAMVSPTKLESMVNDIQDVIAEPIDIVNEEIDPKKRKIDNYDDLESTDAIHIEFITTQASETIDFDNAIDKDKAPAFSAVRNVIRKLQSGSKDYKIMAMSHDKLSKNIPGVKFDMSVAQTPKVSNEKNVVVFVITDANGKPLQFDSSGNVVEKGTVPVFNPVSPKKIREQFFHFQHQHEKPHSKEKLEDSYRLKFEAMFANKDLGSVATEELVDAFYKAAQPLFAKVREAEYTIMDIEPTVSTLGYNQQSDTKTPLSEIKGIDGFSLATTEVDGDNYLSISGSTLEDTTAIVIPNDISTDPQLVETIVEILTNPNLEKNGAPLNSAERRSLLANYIAIDKHSRLKLEDDGTIRIYNKKVKGDVKEAVRNFFNEFNIDGQVKGNPTNRIITKDLADPNNTSAMLYEDASGNLFSIYKPKFSYNEKVYNKVTVENNNVTTERIDTLQHVIKTGSTKATVNQQKELRVYHPKIAYEIGSETHTYSDEYRMNKTQEQKERNELVSEGDKAAALSWFKNSPLGQLLELRDNSMKDTVENRVAVAQFIGNAIVLHAGSDYTDIYHEAWHAYTQGMLDSTNRKKLYAAVGKIKGMENATPIQIEEYLAEEFRAYAIGKSKIKKNSVIGKFFQSIVEFFERLFKGHSKSDLRHPSTRNRIVRQHFNTLYKGKINTSTYDTAKGQFKKLNKTISFPSAKPGELTKLSAQQTMLALDTIDSVISEFIDTKNTEKLNRGFESISDLQQSYTHAKERLEDILKEQTKQMKSFAKNPLSEGYKHHYANVQMLQAVIDNFGNTEDIAENILEDESTNTIIGFHLKNGKVYNYNNIKSIVEEDSAPEKENDSATKNFEKNGTEKSLFDLADEHVVYMLSTIPKYNRKRVEAKKGFTAKKAKKAYDYVEEEDLNTFGVRTLERPVVVMAKLGKLLNSTNNADEMKAKMEEAAKTDPTIDHVLDKLGWKTNYNSNSLNQQTLTSKFVQTFSKSNNKLQQFIIESRLDADGNMIIENKYGSTLGGTKAVSRSWDAAFPTMTSDYITHTPTGIKLNADKIVEDFLTDLGQGKWKLKNEDGYVEFYRALGMNITDKLEIESDLAKHQDVLNAIAQRLQEHVDTNAFRKEKGLAEVKISNLKQLWGRHNVMSADGTKIGAKAFGLEGYYGKIQKIEFDLSDKFNSFMAVNAKGENQSELSLNNTASVMTNDINGIKEGTNIKDVISKNPHLKFLDPANDPMIRANRYFKELFDQDGNRTSVKLTFDNFSGSKLLQSDNSLGLTNMNLDRKSKFMTDVYLSFMNKSEVVRMADKSTSMHMGIDSEQAFNPANILALTKNDPTMYNEMKDYIVAEIVRMNILKTIEGPFDQSYIERGGEFFIFDDILSKKIKSSLEKVDSTDFNEVSKEVSKHAKDIIKDINGYFTTKAEKMLTENSKNLFVTDNILSTIDNEINSNKPEEDRIEITKDKAKEIMIQMYARNKFLHNLDVTTLYLGDPALYNVTKEDFHKRNAGLISTGDVFRTDSSFYNYINSTDKAGMIKARGWSNKVSKANTYNPHDGRITTAIIKDQMVKNGRYLDEYKGILENLGEYDNMNEADGQGFISFDAFRLLSIAQGIWTAQQEEQYNIIVNESTTDADGNVIPGTYDQRKYKDFFPSMKLQYFGPLDTNAPLRQQALHKFNLVPLIPGMIKGTKLETLHKDMMEQGIDYMTFESGSKLSTASNKKDGIDNYYDSERNVNSDIQFEKNVIHTKYLKNQLKISNKFKGKITLPTQLRKILVSNIFKNNGVPNDYKGKKKWKKLSKAEKRKASDKYDWLQRYNEALKNITDFKRAELLNDLGVKNDFSVIKESTKLVNLIRREFTDKDYSEHQIEFLFDNNKLKSDLSTALTADQVEKLLVALVDKRITKLKVNGEGLIQMASSMTEKKEEKGEIEGSNGLRFYHEVEEGGEKVIKSMQVKIALQGDFEKLLYTNDANGNRIAVYNKETNELDYEASLANLNKALKDSRWVEENRKIITLSAPRIPSQAFNSLEFIEIAEFLPKSSGNVMVVPTELVAKSGSDFDVDKLFTMFPNIEVFSGKAELIKYTDINTDVQALENKLETKENELKKLKESTKDVLEELKLDIKDNKALIKTNQELYPLYKERKNLRNKKDVLSKERFTEVENEIDALINQQEQIMNDVFEEGEVAMTNADLKEELNELLAEKAKIYGPREALQKEIDDLNRQILGAGVKGLENNLLDLIVERLKMPSVYPELMKPTDTDLVQPLSKELAESVAEFDKFERVNGEERRNDKGEKQISPTQIFDPMYNVNKQIENSVAMDTLGIGAIGSTYAALFSSIGMYLNPTNGITQEKFEELKAKASEGKTNKKENEQIENHNNYTIQLDHNTTTEIVNGEERTVINLAGDVNVNGVSIPDLLGQMINGWVDVAKDAWIFNIQGNKEVTPTLMFLITAGVDFRQAVVLASSKKVREYIEAKRTRESAFYGLSKFNSENKNTYNLISKSSDVDALNDVLKDDDYVFGNINDVYQDSFDTDVKLDMDKLDDYVLNPTAKRSKKEQEEKNNQEIAALLQYVAYEQTAGQITALTMATKFDTKTSSNLADVRNTKQNFLNLNDNKALPSDIKTRIKDSPIGSFDTNDLQLDLWSQFFSLKTHSVVSETANQHYRGDNYISGRSKADNEKDFSQELISYIYQNEFSRIENNMYHGVKIEKLDEDSEVDYTYENGVFSYNPAIINTEEYPEYGNTNSLIKYFIATELVRENGVLEDTVDYELAKIEFDKLTEEEQEETSIEDLYYDSVATLLTENSEQMFRGPFNYAARFSELKKAHPYLEKEYDLVRDLTPNYSDKGRANLFLSNIKEPGYINVYTENLDALREHGDPEISEFFQAFDRFAVLQSGVQSFGPYVMTQIIDQNHVHKFAGPVKDDIISHFDKLAESEEADYPILNDFTNQYYQADVAHGKDPNPSGFKRFLAEKFRGNQFESDAYFEAVTRKQDESTMSIESLPNAWAIDKVMAEEANKTIIHNVNEYPNPQGRKRSKINKYKAHISQNYPSAVDTNYTANDIVWISGELSSPAQYGSQNNKATFDATLDETFNRSYKPQIKSAIKAGVRNFSVGSNSGIDSRAQKFLSEYKVKGKKFFTKHKIVKEDGVYYVYSTQKELVIDQLYSSLGGEVNIQKDVPSLAAEKSNVALSIGERNYTNFYKYLAANKLKYANKEERIRIGERVVKMKDSATTEDWINVINDIKLDASLYEQYNEWAEIANALYKVSQSNPKFKQDLKDTGKVLLTYGKSFNKFEKNFAKGLMELRKHWNGPVTPNLETSPEDIWSCNK